LLNVPDESSVETPSVCHVLLAPVEPRPYGEHILGKHLARARFGQGKGNFRLRHGVQSRRASPLSHPLLRRPLLRRPLLRLHFRLRYGPSVRRAKEEFLVTIPSEYAQAVQLTHDFLLDLSRGEQVTFEPGHLRERAAALLQHFPETAHPEDERTSAAMPSSTEQPATSPQPGSTNGQRSTNFPVSAGFPRARMPPTESQTVQALVISSSPTPDLVWVRDEQGRQHPLDRTTEGVNLAELRQGQALDCDLVVDGESIPRVAAARVVPRRYPRDEA
jgi:hypothetical protein